MSEVTSPEKEPVRERLKSFQALNPEVKIEHIENACLVNHPWGDETLALRVSLRVSDKLCK